MVRLPMRMRPGAASKLANVLFGSVDLGKKGASSPARSASALAQAMRMVSMVILYSGVWWTSLSASSVSLSCARWGVESRSASSFSCSASDSFSSRVHLAHRPSLLGSRASSLRAMPSRARSRNASGSGSAIATADQISITKAVLKATRVHDTSGLLIVERGGSPRVLTAGGSVTGEQWPTCIRIGAGCLAELSRPTRSS